MGGGGRDPAAAGGGEQGPPHPPAQLGSAASHARAKQRVECAAVRSHRRAAPTLIRRERAGGIRRLGVHGNQTVHGSDGRTHTGARGELEHLVCLGGARRLRGALVCESVSLCVCESLVSLVSLCLCVLPLCRSSAHRLSIASGLLDESAVSQPPPGRVPYLCGVPAAAGACARLSSAPRRQGRRGRRGRRRARRRGSLGPSRTREGGGASRSLCGARGCPPSSRRPSRATC